MTEHALSLVRDARDTVAYKASQFHDGIADRDAAIRQAREYGASAMEIADAASLTRQQVHKILAEPTPNP